MGTKTLGLSFGHGGTDAGLVHNGVKERDELIEIGKTMRLWCAQLGIPDAFGGVKFVDDQLALPGEIKAFTGWQFNAGDRDLAVNIHLDSAARGALAIYDTTPYTKVFAQRWLDMWCRATGIAHRGIYDSKHWARTARGWPDMGFSAGPFPGVILELGSMPSDYDMDVVRDEYWRAFAVQSMIDIWRTL